MFLGADLIERTVIAATLKLRSSSRERVLYRWLRGLGEAIEWTVTRVGGATVTIRPEIRAGPGVLVLANHQSLLDIPFVVGCFEGGYPMIVTRERYSTGVPLISHMIRIYGHPTVRPGERNADQLNRLSTMTATSPRPVVIFPEGSRSRDGEIKPFKTAGLKVILGARRWSVYIVVIDGLWQSPGIGGFVRNVSSIRAGAEIVGPFEFDPDRDDTSGFISAMERQMRDKLREMRGSKRPTAAS